MAEFILNSTVCASGSGCILIAGFDPVWKVGAIPGKIDVVVDRRAPDTDSDGVGNNLEALIGTNSAIKDSDNDGIDDGVELRGILEGPNVQGSSIALFLAIFRPASP